MNIMAQEPQKVMDKHKLLHDFEATTPQEMSRSSQFEESPESLHQTLYHLDDGNSSVQSSNVSSDSSSSSRICRDQGFAVVFLLQLGVVIYFAIHGMRALNIEEDNDIIHWMQDSNVSFWFCCLGEGLFSALLCFSWFQFTIYNPDIMLKATFQIWGISYFIGAIITLLMGNPAICLFCMLGLLATWCLWFIARDRIDFAAATLGTACRGLEMHPSCFIVMIFSMILTTIWALTCMFAFIGIDVISSDGLNGGFVFLVFISFLWGNSVISNMTHVAISGAVASWWFHSDMNQDHKAVSKAYCRACTTSFGSICLGSLVVALIEALRFVVSSIRNQTRSNNVLTLCLGGCLDCILFYAEFWARYFNQYALTYVAIYGYDFETSGDHVADLFSQRGLWNTVINDLVISRVLMLNVLGVACYTAVFGAVLGHIFFSGDVKSINGLTGFGLLIGGLMSWIIANSLGSAVSTIYVAFAEDPQAFQRNHPHEFGKLYDGWNKVC